MSAPANGLTREKARQLRALEVEERRNREAACALEFLVYGDTFDLEDGEPTAHSARCVCTPTCSRDYDPMPYDEAEPVDARLYEGTAIGALYGLPGSEDVVLSLEGWELKPRTVFE